MTIKKIIIMNNRRDHWCSNLNDDSKDDNDDCRIVSDVLFSVYYVHTLQKKYDFVWNSSIYAYTSRMWQNNKHTYIYMYARLLVCFSFSTKKTEKQKKTDDVSTTLLLGVAARASERADGAGETTKRKAWPTSSGNREEKVCVYVAAIGWGKKRRRKRAIAAYSRV